MVEGRCYVFKSVMSVANTPEELSLRPASFMAETVVTLFPLSAGILTNAIQVAEGDEERAR